MREASFTEPGHENCAGAYSGLFYLRIVLERPGEWVVSRLEPGEFRG